MIVWFNCKISDIRPNPQPRYCLRNDSRFDVARYSFASFAPLIPLVSKFIFNLEMADAFAGTEAEMEAWLRGIFPEDKLSIHWYRCNKISEWREIQKEINAVGDPLIFPAGNEDHIFMDSNIEVFKRGLELIANDPDPAATLMTSHYSECVRAAYKFNGQLSACGNYASFYMDNNDAIRVIKKEYFDYYLDQVQDPEMFVFRTEHWNNIGIARNKLYVPTKEQFRHFDGYAHVSIGPGIAPPLEIPTGFFEGMTIKYGFKERDNACVNVNPLANALYPADPKNGADYKFALEDMPAFWSNYIKDIVDADDLDVDACKAARDEHYLQLSRVDFSWPHFNATFNNANYPPVAWVNNHMLVSKFSDPEPPSKHFGSSMSTT